jgi:hypothetical protein
MSSWRRSGGSRSSSLSSLFRKTAKRCSLFRTSNWYGISLPCSVRDRAPQTLPWRSLTHWQSPPRSAAQAYVNRNDSDSLSLCRGTHSTASFVDTVLDSELSCKRCSRAIHSLESARYPRTTTPPACASGSAVQRRRTEDTFRHLRRPICAVAVARQPLALEAAALLPEVKPPAWPRLM